MNPGWRLLISLPRGPEVEVREFLSSSGLLTIESIAGGLSTSQQHPANPSPCRASGRVSITKVVHSADRTETSNRQATRDRAKITKKVAEHKRKSKREAKRNPTWKSSTS